MSWKAILAALIVWHLTCWLMLTLYAASAGRLVLHLYTAAFGDVQASFSRYFWIDQVLQAIWATIPATVAALATFEWLSKRHGTAPPGPTLARAADVRASSKQRVVTFVAWQAAVVLALVFSYEPAAATVRALLWRLFGLPESIFSFWNTVVPRMVAWQLSTTPIAVVALWLHAKFMQAGRRTGTRAAAPASA